MNKVVIAVLVVAAALVVLLGVFRPGADRTTVSVTNPGSAVSKLGSLAPKHDVKPADLAAARCWDDQGVLTVNQGQLCTTVLPEKANRLRVCALDEVAGTLVITGSDYPQQTAKVQDLTCPEGASFDLYDRDNRLTVTCAPNFAQPVCRLRLS